MCAWHASEHAAAPALFVPDSGTPDRAITFAELDDLSARFASVLTECGIGLADLLVGSCTRWFPGQCGSMGRAVPGHEVNILDQNGKIAAPGEDGMIALRAPDPVLFLEYVNKPDKTREAFEGGWLLTNRRCGFARRAGVLLVQGPQR